MKASPFLILIFIVQLIFPQLVISQDLGVIDSLNKIARKVPADTFAVEAMRQIGWEYEGVDNSIYLSYAHKALALSYSVGHASTTGSCLMDIGIAHEGIGSPDSSIYYYKKAISIFRGVNDSDGIAAVYLNMGATYRTLGNFSEALYCFLEALKIAEKNNDQGRTADCKTAIGNIYRQKGNLDIAKKYLEEGLEVYEFLKDCEGIGRAANNLGIVYSELKDHKKAIEYYFKALKIREELKLSSAISTCYSNIGCEYYEMNDLNNSILYHNKALALNTRLDNTRGIAIDLTNLAAVNTKQGKYAEAVAKLQKAKGLAAALKFKDLLKEVYMNLAENYSLMNDHFNAYKHHKKYTEIKDSILNEEENSIIAEMNSKYESEKKDSEIKLLNKSKEVQAADLKRKSIIIWAALVGIVLVLLLAFYIYRGYRLKQKANDIITRQKHEVELQKAIIEEKQKEITDSIHYAKRIQRALLSSDTFLNKELPEHFILYKPKDIVSGDFYWAAKTEAGKVLLMTADCTGHGVPGAFMSLLGVNFLNDITTDKRIVKPNQILDKLRKDIIYALNPEGTGTEAMDGMDAAICSFDFNNMELELAAANNPVWLIRDDKLIEFFPDKMPVGKFYDDERNFSLQRTELKMGDIVYTLTDGYADQFGGPKGKKFKPKALKDLLLSICSLSMEEQRKCLDRNIEEWKGRQEQIDDILIIGVRIH
ncbi:MAG TPA: tetratricopeptide repeat protein [Bacteroidia bacterium]|jgi:serine phosphatase RsbU (regulator of sigma subunit)